MISDCTCGVCLSVTCTLAAFGLLLLHIHTGHTFPTHQELAVAFILLAIVQLAIQLFFFLHVGRGEDRHWNATALGFALFIVAILVGGTLWIMQNLQQHMTNTMQNGTFINGQVNVVDEND